MAKDKHLSSLDRAIQMAMGEGRQVGREDDPAKDTFPALWEWISRIYIGKDRLKQPATITISLAPEGVLVRLNDRDLGCGAAVVCPHLQDAFQQLNAALEGPNPPFTFYGKKEPQLRKRKTTS